MATVMVTTEDNPFDYFTQFEDWYAFDEQKGYHTCSYLARVCKSSNELSITEQEQCVEDAVNEIVAFNLTGNYKKVVFGDDSPAS